MADAGHVARIEEALEALNQAIWNAEVAGLQVDLIVPRVPDEMRGPRGVPSTRCTLRITCGN